MLPGGRGGVKCADGGLPGGKTIAIRPSVADAPSVSPSKRTSLLPLGGEEPAYSLSAMVASVFAKVGKWKAQICRQWGEGICPRFFTS